MAIKDEAKPLSPTVSQVIDKFVAAMTADDKIDNDAISRLDALLRQGTVPKAEEINAAFFDPVVNAIEGGDE